MLTSLIILSDILLVFAILIAALVAFAGFHHARTLLFPTQPVPKAFRVWLTSVEEGRQIAAIKQLRAYGNNLGLREAKDVMDSVRSTGRPYCINVTTSREKAEAIQKGFAEAPVYMGNTAFVGDVKIEEIY